MRAWTALSATLAAFANAYENEWQYGENWHPLDIVTDKVFFDVEID